MDPKTTFLSCDWGTSAFRLRLVEREPLKILAETSSREGNAATAERWRQAGQPPGQRAAFYRAILHQHLQELETTAKTSLAGVPVVVSGMASSTIGMRELPYKALPFATDGTDLLAETLPPTPDFAHPLLLVSGVRSADDVMRGEETQLVGCRFENTAEQQLFLHPGTHAKHVLVQHGQAIGLKTYLTGELFALLTTHSILAASVEAGGQLHEGNHLYWFEHGVRTSRGTSLLHNAFGVRTNDLFKKAGKRENYFYLSGLLIGSECQELCAGHPTRIVLAGEPHLVTSYAAALRVLDMTDRCPVQTKTAAEVTLQGQLALLRHHLVIPGPG